MFVLNFKLNYKKIFIVILLLAICIALFVEFNNSSSSNILPSSNTQNYDYVFNDENYTKFLRQIHEDIEANINKTVKISGYVFRMPDFKETYFVVGKNVIVDNEDMYAGFLCSFEDASKVQDNEWVEVTGVILKGNYNTDVPILKIGSLKKIDTPQNTFVE